MRLGFLVLPPRLLERYRQGAGFLCLYGPCAGAERSGPFHRRGPLRAPPLPDAEGISGPPLRHHQRLPGFAAGQPCHLFRGGAGLHFLLRLDTNRSDEELRRLTVEAGIRLSFLSEYAAVPDPRFAHTLVINYAGLSQSDLEEALQLLTDVLLPLLA